MLVYGEDDNFNGGHWWDILKASHRKTSGKTILWFACIPKSNNLKIGRYIKLQFCVRVVVDYGDTQISHFANEHLRKTKKFANAF